MPATMSIGSAGSSQVSTMGTVDWASSSRAPASVGLKVNTMPSGRRPSTARNTSCSPPLPPSPGPPPEPNTSASSRSRSVVRPKWATPSTSAAKVGAVADGTTRPTSPLDRLTRLAALRSGT